VKLSCLSGFGFKDKILFNQMLNLSFADCSADFGSNLNKISKEIDPMPHQLNENKLYFWRKLFNLK
jgi:hypothetical protein